eukprot:gb/GECG01015589.1/.p1 GENE.gb/GECG01015589.1/~~gb/GECG01015589.1/.p1  ORF type:complete len:1237 (+),score=186.41 gb/GECG01015589.1/:1-3711(+)
MPSSPEDHVATLTRCRTRLFDEGPAYVGYAPTGTLYTGGFPGDIGSLFAFFETPQHHNSDDSLSQVGVSNEPDVQYKPVDGETPVLQLSVNSRFQRHSSDNGEASPGHTADDDTKLVVAEPIKAVTDSMSSDTLLRSGCDVSLRKLKDLSMEANLLRTTTGISSLEISPSGSIIFIATFGGEAFLLNTETKKQTQFVGHNNFCIRDATWAPQENLLATLGYDGYCRVFDISGGTPKEVGSYLIMERKNLPKLSSSNQWTLAWNPRKESSFIAVTGLKDVLMLHFEYQQQSLQESFRLAGHSKETTLACWSPNGLFLLTSDKSVIPEIKVWHAAKQVCADTFYNSNSEDLSDNDGNAVSDISWHPSHSYASVVDNDGWLARFSPVDEKAWGSPTDSELAEREWELLQTRLSYTLGDEELDAHFSKMVESEAHEDNGEENEMEQQQREDEDDEEEDVCPSSRSRRKRIRNPEILNEVPSMPKVTASEQDSVTMVKDTESTTATESGGEHMAREKQDKFHETESTMHGEIYNPDDAAYAASPPYSVQEPFQPGSISKEHATVGMGGTRWRYLAWTPDVRVISITDTAGNHRLEIAFTDINRGSSIRFVDDVGYEIAGIGEAGVAFATTTPDDDEPCQLRFRNFHSWSGGDDSIWDVALPSGEIPQNIAVGREWVAVAVAVTSHYCETETYRLRIWGTSGIEMAALSLSGPTITMNAVGSLLGICFSNGGTVQCSLFACPDSRNTTLQSSCIASMEDVFSLGGIDGVSGIAPNFPIGSYPVHLGTVASPVQGERRIEWAGFTPSGLFCLMDDFGIMNSLCPPNGWLWMPLLDTKSTGKSSDRHFVLGLKDDSLISVLLKQGQQAPRCAPSGKSTPLVSKTSFEATRAHCFGGAVSALSVENQQEIGKCIIERLNLDMLRWAGHIGIRLDVSDNVDTDDPDLSGDVSYVGPFGVGFSSNEDLASEVTKKEKKLDKRILKQVGNLIKVDAVAAAFQLCTKLVTPKAHELAVQFATKANHRGLMTRLHALRIARHQEQNTFGNGNNDAAAQSNSQELAETKQKVAELSKLVNDMVQKRSAFDSPDENGNNPPGRPPSSRSARYSYSKRYSEVDLDEPSSKTSRNLNDGHLSETQVSTPPRTKGNSMSNPFAQGSVSSPSRNFEYDERDKDVFAKFAPSPARVLKHSTARGEDRAKRGLGEHVPSSYDGEWDGDLHAESLVRNSTFSREARNKKQNDIRAMSSD